MKSYIEFVYLFHCSISIASVYISAFFLNQYVSNKRVWMGILMSNILLVFFYNQWTLMFVLLLECLAIWIHTRRLSMMAMELCIRYITILCMYVFYKGTIYHGVWYMPVDSYAWIVVSILYGMVSYLCTCRLSLVSKLKEYSYRLTISFSDYHVPCYGYWDSGNFATYHQLPVIFLHDKRLLQMETMEEIEIQTKRLPVIQGYISGVHIPKQKVYIAYLPKDVQSIYPCLLNQLLERGSPCGCRG